jgi:amino acid adenylation domain-containing protein
VTGRGGGRGGAGRVVGKRSETSSADRPPREAGRVSRATIPRAARSGPLPLSFAQERIWFLEQLEPGLALHNTYWAARLDGRLDMRSLQLALSAIVARHEPLRTVVEVEGGAPRQRILAPCQVALPVVDLRHVAPETREREALSLIGEELARPFDLNRDLMVRGRVVRIADDAALLLLVIHHIASDGASWEIFSHELETFYNAAVRGEAVRLPELSIQYADFAVWQRERIANGGGERDLAFWRAQLATLPGTLDLPADRPRAPRADHGGGRVDFTFPRALSAALADLERREGVTRFMTFVAALLAVLHRHTGEDAVALGSPISGRVRSELEPLIGLFLNTLVLGADLGGDPTFRALLRAVRATCVAAYDHQDAPFEQLVADLQPERVGNRNPLFEVMLAYLNEPPRTPTLAGLEVELLVPPTATTRFDLRFEIVGGAKAMTGSITYRTSMFDRWRIERIAEHLEMLLAGIAENPDRPLSQLPLLTSHERETLTRLGVGPRLPAPPLCLHRVFEGQAQRTPDEPAVVSDRGSATYRALDERANQFAHALRRVGVTPGSRVGVCLERSIDAVAAVLAVLKAGAAYVPVEPSHPRERLGFVLADADVAAIVTHARWLEGLAGLRPVVLCLDRDDVSAESRSRLDTVASPSDAAYVIYTSGSTGTPKGVVVEHHSVVNYVASLMERLALPGPASFAWLQPLSVDSSVSSLYGALLSGGSLIVVSEDDAVDPTAVAACFEAHRVDVLKIAPTHLAALHAAGQPARLLPRQRLVLGGEPSSETFVSDLARLAPDLAIFNHYGPTEATVGVTMYRASPPFVRTGLDSVPMGRPLGNVELRVLDRYGQRAPLGVAGELWIGGACLARGYHRRDDLTAERFVARGAGSADSARFYRTGDRVRYLPAGDLAFLGRSDQQLKIHGVRVEPAEVERALESLPDVAEAAVIAGDASDVTPRLVACVVPAGSAPPPIERLRRGLATLLPGPMIPTGWAFLPALPRTAHGKLDVRALRAATYRVEVSRSDVAAPSTATERRVAEIWSEALGIARVGAQDNFFELGGHSLLAVRIAARLAAVLGVPVAIRELFDCPTVAELAHRIDERIDSGTQAGDRAT